MVQNVQDFYSILSNVDIGSGFEIDPHKTLELKSYVLLDRYFKHCFGRTPLDHIKFQVFEDDTTKENREFSIVFEKDGVRVEHEKLKGYEILKKKSKNGNSFEFVLKTKEIDSGTDF